MNRFAKAFVFCVMLCELLASAQRDCLGQQSDTNKSAASFPSQWFFQSLRGQASQEREWPMSDGLKLRGRAVVDGMEKLEIQSTSGEEPQVVRLSISELPPESKKLILDALPKVEDRFLRFAYYQGAEVNPVWSGAQPKFPQRFRLAVHDDQTHVYFSSGESLILVEKAAFTEASLKETLEAIAKVRHQLVLSVDNKFLRAVGVPVQLTTQDVVMEVKQPYTYSSLKFNAGLRYLLPLQSLTPLQQEVCKTVVADVQAETKPTQLSDEQLRALPRVCFTAMSQRFVMPRSTSSPDTVMAGEQTQQMQAMSANELSCSDYLWWAGNGKGASSSDSAGKPEISPELLTVLVDTTATREFWMQKSGIPFRGQLVGSVADGFIFESRGMGQFFVPATQLHNVDATIALTFSRFQPPKAVADKIVNLKSVFARRVISDGALVELRDEMVSLKGAYVGELPKIIYAGTQNRSFVPNHFSDLAAINEIQKWLRENATILEASDAAAGIQQLASKYPMSLQPADTKLMPSQRVQKWQLAQRGVSFEALVVGEHEGDLVFETTVKDRKEKFLVDPRALDPTSASEAQKFVARLEPKDWSSELTRHANWQNYRIWADPSGKLKVPTDPVVVLSISESLVRFATLDGREYSEPMPFDTTRKLATVSLFGKALERSSKDRAKAESNLTLWSFQDSEPKVRATLVGLADDCILVRDVNQVEFLINKITLSTESQTALESLVKTTSNLRRLDSAEVWKTPRVWCTRTTVVGPAVPEYLTDNDATLVIVQINGEKQLLKLKDLTLREQLSFLAAWHLKQNKLERPSEGPVADSLQTVDKWLSAEIPATEQITAIPKLDAVIEGQIKSAFEQWKHSAWESQNISLPADSQLLAINADATAGVVSVNSSWSLVDFATGRTQVLSHAPQAKPESSPSHVGPWMGTASDVVYWIDNGQVRYARPGRAEAAEVIRDLQPVLAANQSGDFRFLVVLLADNTVRRIDLSNQQHDVVFTADMLGNVAARAPSLWSSSDGLSILLSRGTSTQLLVKRSDTTPALAAYLGSAKPTATAAVGKSQAWFSTESQPRGLTRIVGSTMLLPPSTYGTAFPTQWFGPVDIEGREVFQAIGRFEDLQSQSQDRYYVTYTGPRDYFEEYPTQWIDGQVDQRARVAADGAAMSTGEVLKPWSHDAPRTYRERPNSFCTRSSSRSSTNERLDNWKRSANCSAAQLGTSMVLTPVGCPCTSEISRYCHSALSRTPRRRLLGASDQFVATLSETIPYLTNCRQLAGQPRARSRMESARRWLCRFSHSGRVGSIPAPHAASQIFADTVPQQRTLSSYTRLSHRCCHGDRRFSAGQTSCRHHCRWRTLKECQPPSQSELPASTTLARQTWCCRSVQRLSYQAFGWKSRRHTLCPNGNRHVRRPRLGSTAFQGNGSRHRPRSRRGRGILRKSHAPRSNGSRLDLHSHGTGVGPVQASIPTKNR